MTDLPQKEKMDLLRTIGMFLALFRHSKLSMSTFVSKIFFFMQSCVPKPVFK